MKFEIDIDDDALDELFIQRLKADYFMIKDDLERGMNDQDVKWMVPVRDALYTLITGFYGKIEDVNGFDKGE